MNKKEALTQLEIMATNATGRLGSAKSEEEKALLNKHIEALNMAMDALKDYKPKTGHWIMHIDDLFPADSTQECSECHEWQFIYLGNDDNYCPNCGSYNGGKNE